MNERTVDGRPTDEHLALLEAEVRALRADRVRLLARIRELEARVEGRA